MVSDQCEVLKRKSLINNIKKNQLNVNIKTFSKTMLILKHILKLSNIFCLFNFKDFNEEYAL